MWQRAISSSGGGKEATILMPTSVTTNSTESSSYPAENSTSVYPTMGRRWSSATNTLAYLEYTFSEAVCVNRIDTLICVTTDTANDCTAKIQGYDGSSWVDIETLSYTATEVKSHVIRRINNSNKYTRYRFTFTSYPYNASSSRAFCGMGMCLLINEA